MRRGQAIICGAVSRVTPQGQLCSPAKIQRLTYIEPCKGEYYPPEVYAATCGCSLCRGRRLDDPLTRQRHRKAIHFARVV